MQSLKGVDLALMALGSPTATDLYSRGSIVADLAGRRQRNNFTRPAQG